MIVTPSNTVTGVNDLPTSKGKLFLKRPSSTLTGVPLEPGVLEL